MSTAPLSLDLATEAELAQVAESGGPQAREARALLYQLCERLALEAARALAEFTAPRLRTTPYKRTVDNSPALL